MSDALNFLLNQHGKIGLWMKRKLVNNDEICEDEEVQKTDFHPKAVRQIFYELRDAGIATLRKEETEEREYKFHWSLDEDSAIVFANNRQEKLLEKLKEYKERMLQNDIYKCSEDCGVRVNMDDATSNDFTCGNCGSRLIREDTGEKISVVDKHIEILESKINS